MFLLFNTLSRLVIAFLPKSKCFLISRLHSPSAGICQQGIKETGPPRGSPRGVGTWGHAGLRAGFWAGHGGGEKALGQIDHKQAHGEDLLLGKGFGRGRNGTAHPNGAVSAGSGPAFPECGRRRPSPGNPSAPPPTFSAPPRGSGPWASLRWRSGRRKWSGPPGERQSHREMLVSQEEGAVTGPQTCWCLKLGHPTSRAAGSNISCYSGATQTGGFFCYSGLHRPRHN